MTDGPNSMKSDLTSTVGRACASDPGTNRVGLIESNAMMRNSLSVDNRSTSKARHVCARACEIDARTRGIDARAFENDVLTREDRRPRASAGATVGRRGPIWWAAIIVVVNLLGATAHAADQTVEPNADAAPVMDEVAKSAPVSEQATDASKPEHQADKGQAIEGEQHGADADQKTNKDSEAAEADRDQPGEDARSERRSRLREVLHEMSEGRPGNRIDGAAVGPGRGMGPVGPDRAVDFRVVSAEEWDEIVQFLSEYAPFRLRMYQEVESRIGVDSRAARMLRFRLASGHRRMLEAQAQGPELFRFAVNQFKLEDSILEQFDLMRREGETPEHRVAIRDLLRKFVENNFAERESRLSRLRAALEREEQLLSQDRLKFDEFVESRERQFREQMEQLQRRREMIELGIPPGEDPGPRRRDERPRGDGPRGEGPRGEGEPRGGPGRDGERRPRD
jgi:hypothetical protein